MHQIMPAPDPSRSVSPRRRRTAPMLAAVLLAAAGLHAQWALALMVLRIADPPTTAVHVQRRVEALLTGRSYRKRHTFTPLGRISRELQHAVISAEDGRFYHHRGIDFEEIEKVLQESGETGEAPRGASTLTQQLVKNLFFTTHRNPVRKVLEYTLAPMADLLLGKARVLELYLNVAEWGPGVYGAEEAARHHYGVAARQLQREQAARLAACLPSPLRRRPARMDQYSAQILRRMERAGW